jgi:hypothetical protein
METGKPQTYQAGDEIKFYDVGHIAPCRRGWACPKISPENEKEFILSDRNELVLKLYHRVRICGPASIGKIDTLLAEMLSICDQVFNGFDRAAEERQHFQLMLAVSKSVRISQ